MTKYRRTLSVRDGKKPRKTKQEQQQEMMKIKEGAEEQTPFDRKTFLEELKKDVINRPTKEELELEKKEEEEKRARLVEMFKPKKAV